MNRSESGGERWAVLLCEKSGVMAAPWAAAGYRCLCIDTQHPQRSEVVEGNIVKRWGDVRSLTPQDIPGPVVFAAAFPPCTDLTGAAARDWPRKGLRRLIDALELVEACRILLEYTGAPWMLENPIGRLSTIWRQPDHNFNPCDFGGYLEPAGDAYTKRTCLWTGGGFVMPDRRPVEPTEGSKMHRVAPGPERANIRSLTPAGFALAVYLANAPECRAQFTLEAA